MAMRRNMPYSIICKMQRVEYQPEEGPVDWDAYISEHLQELFPAFENSVPVITSIIQATNPNIYTKPEDVDVLMKLRKKKRKAMPSSPISERFHASDHE